MKSLFYQVNGIMLIRDFNLVTISDTKVALFSDLDVTILSTMDVRNVVENDMLLHKKFQFESKQIRV